jgi:hypothetical protein
MSRRARIRAGMWLLALYPEAWRERYRAEVAALLEDDPPAARGLASLVTGAAGAHMRPRRSWRTALDPRAGMRTSITGLLCCWIALSLCGISFQKDTEDSPFVSAASAHPLLRLAHTAVEAGALLGALAIAVGGLPLLWEALLHAWRRRDVRFGLLIASPLMAAALLAGFTVLLGALAPARGDGFPARFVLEILLPWTLGIYACALVAALTPRAVLRRIDPSERALRRACDAGAVLALAMCLVAGGMLLYAPALWLTSPRLTGTATGPYGAGVGAMLAIQAATALAFTCLGALAASRARRWARARTA